MMRTNILITRTLITMEGCNMTYQKKLEEAARLIQTHQKVYALTGAGISTESGLPDFRSPGTGLWTKVDPTKYSTAQVLYENPDKFFRFGFERFYNLRKAEPNRGHFALAWMEKERLLQGVITQNIDGLHYKAGSEKVWEVHGHLRTGYCIDCTKEVLFEELMTQHEQNVIPPKCTCGGMLRPSVVLFGDSLGDAFAKAEQTLSWGCDLMLVVGSSLTVYPVASLPSWASRLILINLQPTPFDNDADVLIQDESGKALEDLVEQLKFIN